MRSAGTFARIEFSEQTAELREEVQINDDLMGPNTLIKSIVWSLVNPAAYFYLLKLFSLY